MTKEEKNQAIEALAGQLSENTVIYLADVSELDAEKTSKLRRLCFNRQVKLQTVKNTLLAKAMERVEGKNFGEMPEALKGSTSLMLSEVGNVPAKLIKEFRKNEEKPILKAAYVEEAVFMGDDKLETLASLKSKNELLGEIIGLLQSPPKTVISQLQSGGQKLSGIIKTLEERAA